MFVFFTAVRVQRRSAGRERGQEGRAAEGEQAGESGGHGKVRKLAASSRKQGGLEGLVTVDSSGKVNYQQ